jgi:molybdopterin/thiamine biosynthesis adenylyltransferase
VIADPRFSRPVSAAARLRNSAPDCHRFIDKRVLLTGEAPTLNTANGRECLLSSLRLLVRICPNVSIVLPTGDAGLLNECRRLSDRIAFGRRVEFPGSMPDLAGYDAILSVGTQARTDLPWTVINSNGWLVHVSSGSRSLPVETNQCNPIGAVGAACLGVTDVFKRLIRLKESRARLFDGLAFSLYSYRCNQADPGPALPEDLPLELLLVGAGAIGNCCTHLLSRLPTSGHIWIVDGQVFGEENLGTCVLIGPGDVGVSKAEFAARLFEGQLQGAGFHEQLAEFQSRLGGGVPYPRVILNGLDNIDARHEAQSWWPDILIDGAISDFKCQVSRHQWGDDTACLMCLFRQPPGPSAEFVQSSATGLSQARVQQSQDIVTEEDVQIAPVEKREWLRERIGLQICSVIQEGMVQKISEDKHRKGFAPSVPFVAGLSACMVVGELVKFTAGWTTELDGRFQFDSLCGPAFGEMFPQGRRSDCECVTRAHNINKWRQRCFPKSPAPSR